MTAATTGNLPPIMPQGNLLEVLGREVRKGSPGELMVESSPSRQRRPPCKTNKGMSDEAVDPAAHTYLLTSEALAKEASGRMDVQLDLSMRTAGVLREYQAKYQCVLNCLEARLIDGYRWCKDNQYLYYEDRIVVTEARLDGCLQWSHLTSWHTGCIRSVEFFREHFYSRLTCVELRARLQSIVDSCGCHARRQSESRDRGLVSSLPTTCCANLRCRWISSTVCLSSVVMCGMCAYQREPGGRLSGFPATQRVFALMTACCLVYALIL